MIPVNFGLCPAHRLGLVACALTAPLLATARLEPTEKTRTTAAEEATVQVCPYGTMPDGTAVQLYTLKNGRGLEATVMTLGATLTTVTAPDRDGTAAVITLHRESLEEYLRGHPLLGSIVGRFANRIAGARFTLDGVTHEVVANAGKNHIHGGGREHAFHWQVWRGEAIEDEKHVGVRLSLVSPDGQAGFPGELRVSVEYRLTIANELVMEYTATTTKPTHVNLTNHAYWNLAGATSGDILGHVLELRAEKYLPSRPDRVPTGEIRSVEGSPMSFLEPRAIGSRLDEVERNHYDHCYVLSKDKGKLALAARVVETGSGRVMEVFTTQPGVQLYTGNKMGLCLETQHFPNTPNEPGFPSTVLRPGETFHEVTLHRFSTIKGSRR